MSKIHIIYSICLFHLKSLFDIVIWFFVQILRENFTNYIEYKPNRGQIYLLANGPSLSKDIPLIIDELKNNYVCVVNHFCNSFYYTIIKPSYYILADPAFLTEKYMNNEALKTLDLLQNLTKWDMTLFVPFSKKKYITRRFKKESNITIIPFHSNSYTGWTSVSNYLYRIGLSMPKALNVLIPQILIAINSGFNEIKLYGVDHSWTLDLFVNDQNIVCSRDIHFYDNEEQLKYKPYKNINGEPYKMWDLLYYLAQVFEAYPQLRIYAESRGCKIYNMTKGSFIEAFKRC